MWRATLGAVTDPVNLFGGHHVRLAAPEPFRDAPPPTVTGDLLIAPTNAGEVVAVDRFSGEVRWVRPYPPAMVAGKDAVQLGKMVILPPLPRAAVLRWTAPAVVCGDVVWIAPQDAADAWGLDRSTGQVRWRTASLPDDATCVGVVDGRFVIAGQAVTFVDPATGAADETWTPPRGAALTGPPTVVSGQISVTSTAGVLHPARQASGG
jgi:outer membrane protein assembly factor BamB